MSRAYDDLGGSPETYEEALARSLVMRPAEAQTEQEIAAKLVEDRDRMRLHDRHFATDFMSLDEERLISKALMKRLGYEVGNE